MDVLAGRTSSTSPSVTVSAVGAELPVNGDLQREQAEYWRATLADAPEPLEVRSSRVPRSRGWPGAWTPPRKR